MNYCKKQPPDSTPITTTENYDEEDEEWGWWQSPNWSKSMDGS